MASSPMHHVASLGRFKLYYAHRAPSCFEKPGLHLWTGKRHRYVLRLPKRKLR